MGIKENMEMKKEYLLRAGVKILFFLSYIPPWKTGGIYFSVFTQDLKFAVLLVHISVISVNRLPDH